MSGNRNVRLGKKARKYAIIKSVKENTPCADCGKYYPYWCMDFDHVRGVKSGPMTRFVAGHSMKALMDEITKCDVVCAICHRNRTHYRSFPEEYTKSVSTQPHISQTPKSSTEPCKSKSQLFLQ